MEPDILLGIHKWLLAGVIKNHPQQKQHQKQQQHLCTNSFLPPCLFPFQITTSLSKWAADNLVVWIEMSSGGSRQLPSEGLTVAAREMVFRVEVGERTEFMCSDYCLPLRRLTCTFHLMSVLKQ